MKTLLAFETDTPSDLRAQSMAVAAMGPAIEAFEKAMGELGHKGMMTVRHVRAPRAKAEEPSSFTQDMMNRANVETTKQALDSNARVTPIMPGAAAVGR